MMKVILHTPIFVWCLLAYLLWGGWKAGRMYIASWKTLLIMPAIMITWSVYTIIARHSIFSISFWAVSIIVGIWIGSVTIRRLSLRFDKGKNLIEIPGSWTPLILSFSIFILRYFLGVTYGLHPELRGNSTLLVIENMATVISGIFTGRLIGYWKRAKLSHHTDLAQL